MDEIGLKYHSDSQCLDTTFSHNMGDEKAWEA